MADDRLDRIEKKIDTMQAQLNDISTKVIRLETIEQVTAQQDKMKKQSRTQWIAIGLTLFIAAMSAIKIWLIGI